MIVQKMCSQGTSDIYFFEKRGESVCLLLLLLLLVEKNGGGTVLVLFLLLLLLLLEPKTAELVNLQTETHLVQPIPESPKPLYHYEVALNKNQVYLNPIC